MTPLLLAPAGNFESLSAALNHGADAVYFGVGSLNMRSRATVNFREEDLPLIAGMCHERGVQAWLTINTVVFDEELDSVRSLCKAAKEAGIDAVIAADTAVLMIAQEHGLGIHLSVQANIGNLEAVRFLRSVRGCDGACARAQAFADQENLRRHPGGRRLQDPPGSSSELKCLCMALCAWRSPENAT